MEGEREGACRIRDGGGREHVGLGMEGGREHVGLGMEGERDRGRGWG